MKSFLIPFALALPLLGCTTGDDEATAVLAAEGYTEIRAGGVSVLGCGEHDKMGREFTAKNVRGAAVRGIVCCGVAFKGCTVRH